MVDEAREKEIFEKLAEAVIEYDEDMAKEWAEIAIAEGVNAFKGHHGWAGGRHGARGTTV